MATGALLKERLTETAMRYDASLLTDQDLHLFNEGSHFDLYRKLGAHPSAAGGSSGASFAVWAPNAEAVSVIGDFNGWNPDAHPLRPRGGSGIWEGFIAGAGEGTKYKYHIRSRHNGYRIDKADPFAFYAEQPPLTASIVRGLDYQWSDGDWMTARRERQAMRAPMSVYEVHLGSWRRVPEEMNRPLNYREIAPELAEYAKRMGFTHVELMPVMEHPFYGSWGYQVTGFFAPTSRYGTPQDFMHLVDTLHRHGIGVILDWVPSHFPSDAHGLAYFDGTHLYEHADARKGFHPDWGSLIFNYGRHEVRSFLISNALFWLDKYHADCLRVDAVASMLYLDYSRQPGEWVPNDRGGRENLEAIAFLRRMNEAVYSRHPDTQTIAEESTAWPMVSRPTSVGGLGFGFKWDMGWMHDTLDFMSRDAVYRSFHQDQLTFRMLYAFNENFALPLSHDEVVHGKGSLIGRMPGEEWQQFANLRLLFGWQFFQPGKKLLFMGGEFGQRCEWSHETSLDWHLLESPLHAGLQRWVGDLNAAYRSLAPLHEGDVSPAGFEWIDCRDAQSSVFSFLRRADDGRSALIACNFTPIPRHGYKIGAPEGGHWKEILNSDAAHYGGSGSGNLGGVRASDERTHGRPHTLTLTLPPLSALLFQSPSSQEAR